MPYQQIVEVEHLDREVQCSSPKPRRNLEKQQRQSQVACSKLSQRYPTPAAHTKNLQPHIPVLHTQAGLFRADRTRKTAGAKLKSKAPNVNID